MNVAIFEGDGCGGGIFERGGIGGEGRVWGKVHAGNT